MSKKYDIFLSYPNKDREWARHLADELSQKNLNVWYDDREIKPGESLLERMEEGLRQSAYVVLIITPETTHSNWMAAELGAALALKKYVIPIIAEDTPLGEIPGPIKLRKYILKDNPEIVAEEIARSIASEHKKEEQVFV